MISQRCDAIEQFNKQNRI